MICPSCYSIPDAQDVLNVIQKMILVPVRYLDFQMLILTHSLTFQYFMILHSKVNIHSIAMAEKHSLTLKIDKDQELAIRNLFESNGWEFEKECEIDQDHSGDIHTNEIIILPKDERIKCLYCFCQPCVTDETFRQLWWCDNPEPPGPSNSSIRKDMYKRFWVMLSHRGAWSTDEYIQKRTNALESIRNNNIVVRREIMPDCVLKMVRGWYPNPPNMAYMGHKWI